MTKSDDAVLSQVHLKKKMNELVSELTGKGYEPEKKNDQTYKEFNKGDLTVSLSYEECDQAYFGVIIRDGRTLKRTKIITKASYREFADHFRKVDRYCDRILMNNERCVKTQL